MGLKYSKTTADYLAWSEAMNLIRNLAKDGNYKISLLVAIGCFTGLRISDILALTGGCADILHVLVPVQTVCTAVHIEFLQIQGILSLENIVG